MMPKKDFSTKANLEKQNVKTLKKKYGHFMSASERRSVSKKRVVTSILKGQRRVKATTSLGKSPKRRKNK